jgi:hypothetical protein
VVTQEQFARHQSGVQEMIRFSQLAEIGRDFVRISWMHVWYSPDIPVKVQAQASLYLLLLWGQASPD